MSDQARGREIDLMQLSLEQLNSLKQQHEEELQNLGARLEQLAIAKSRFQTSRNVLEDMQGAPEGRQMLVPLTQSLYVPGRIKEPSKVMVDIGTGYYVEKSLPKAKEFMERKIQLINSNIDNIEALSKQKRGNLEMIVMMMNMKINQIRMAREAAEAKAK